MITLLYHLRRTLSWCSPRKRWRVLSRNVKAWARFWGRFYQYSKMVSPAERPGFKRLSPCIHDDTGTTEIEPIYFYQDNWAFKKIVEMRPISHVDIGSHHKFIALLSFVVPTTMVDIRPLSLPVPRLSFREGTILRLPFADGSCPSVSSICVIEHIGLGRYGDPLDPDGTVKAAVELKRVLQPGGDLYISVPIERRTEVHFDANRVFTEPDLLALFQELELVESRYIYGNEFTDQLRQDRGGVGCYHFRRSGT